jgi:hypothetical protein
MPNCGIRNAVNAVVFFADGGYDLVPEEAVKSKEERYTVERGGGYLCQIDGLKGFEVYFSYGFGSERRDGRQLGSKRRRISEESRGYVDLGMCAEEKDAWRG